MNVDLEYLHLFQRNKFKFWRFFSLLINSIKSIIGLNTAFKSYFSVLVSQKLNTFTPFNYLISLRESFQVV
jgi:hypothetical protein